MISYSISNTSLNIILNQNYEIYTQNKNITKEEMNLQKIKEQISKSIDRFPRFCRK